MSRPSSSILRELIPEAAIVVNSSIMLSFYLLQFVYGPKKEIPLLPGWGKTKRPIQKNQPFHIFKNKFCFLNQSMPGNDRRTGTHESETQILILVLLLIIIV